MTSVPNFNDMLSSLLGAEKLGAATVLFDRLTGDFAGDHRGPATPDCYLSVEGGIASGKSEWLKKFKEFLEEEDVLYEFSAEPVEYWQKMPIGDTEAPDPLFLNTLEKMYEDSAKNGAAFQQIAHMTRLNEFETKCMALWDVPQGKRILVSDRSLISNKMFVRLLRNAGKLDHISFIACDLIGRVYSWCHPTIFIYLRTDPAIAAERIKTRGIPEEQGISLDYLEKMAALHDTKFGDGINSGDGTIGESRVIVLDNNRDHAEKTDLEWLSEFGSVLTLMREDLAKSVAREKARNKPVAADIQKMDI